MTPEVYIDDAYCPVCDAETQHKYYNAGHERDSSHNQETCLACGAYRSGLTDKWIKAEKQ
jgi:hypothetical protein